MEEKVLFLGQIFEMEILMDLHVMKTPESKKSHFYRLVSVHVCVSVISITQKQKQQKHQIWYSTFVSHTDAT